MLLRTQYHCYTVLLTCGGKPQLSTHHKPVYNQFSPIAIEWLVRILPSAVKVGKCNTAKPGFFDFEGQRKWTAWKQLEDMSAEQAMQEYVSCVTSQDPDSSQKERRERRTGFGRPAVSSLYQEEMIREEDRNIFDYCRENNIEHITTAISSKKVDVNAKDEEGRNLLHWACDRGHKDLVSVLLQNSAGINSQVSLSHTYTDIWG
ncbi:unnamed protein product [Oncorhynchus mykiss]|uniref:Acyl-CoA-binding domain-containing protein 6 n=1 Tax=Oncorhynchus mykiss TaxID=8022 RepID=A0A060YHI7_ONCMY|nr:unnamed protein product [Oncorhynchus mykiss]